MVNEMPTVMLWICKQFNIPCPQLEYYVKHRDGENGMIQRIMDETQVHKAKAKQMPIIAMTSGKNFRSSNMYLKEFDVEMKKIQKALMERNELKWILPFCKEVFRNIGRPELDPAGKATVERADGRRLGVRCMICTTNSEAPMLTLRSDRTLD